MKDDKFEGSGWVSESMVVNTLVARAKLAAKASSTGQRTRAPWTARPSVMSSQANENDAAASSARMSQGSA